jgi:2-polyprenyl-6-methoxyphenol hydroxylase-like FAD-dependent oxidoreductase
MSRATRARGPLAQLEIVGGGTEGTVLAAWLARSGIRVRVRGVVLSDPDDTRTTNRRRRER